MKSVTYTVLLVASLLANASAHAGPSRLRCDSIKSGSGAYQARFAFEHLEAQKNVFVTLCDMNDNCDTVFQAPASAAVNVRWSDQNELIVSYNQGNPLAAQTSLSSGNGRPNVPIEYVVQSGLKSDRNKTALQFNPSSCNIKPVVQTVSEPSTRR